MKTVLLTACCVLAFSNGLLAADCSTPTGSLWTSVVIPVAIMIATAALVVFALLSWRTAQVVAYREIVSDYFDSERIRDFRSVLLREQVGVPFADWSEPKKRAAREVCQAYHVIGMMIRKRRLPKWSMIPERADVIRETFAAAYPYMKTAEHDHRADWKHGKGYFWTGFYYLKKKAEKYIDADVCKRWDLRYNPAVPITTPPLDPSDRTNPTTKPHTDSVP